MQCSNNVVVRKCHSNNVNEIIGVLKTIYLQDEKWAENALRKLLSMENYKLMIAELNGKVVGFIGYYVLPSIWKKWNEATINYFFVHKEFQGRGIGSKLLKEVIRQMDEMGIAELHVETEKENKRAIRLYKKHGFLKEFVLLERSKQEH